MRDKIIYDFVLELEKQNQEVSQKLGQLKQIVGEIVEDNTRLKLENEALLKQLNSQKEIAHEIFKQSTTVKKEVKKKFDIRSKENLEKLYNEGFHICSDSFGKLRTDECIFCSPLLRRR